MSQIASGLLHKFNIEAYNSPDGGIGRRAGLKHQWIFRAGSTPAPGTILKKEVFFNVNRSG